MKEVVREKAAEPSLLEKHEAMARKNPKLYFRDERNEWGGRAESYACREEAAAYDARRANDEARAKSHDDNARRWRILIRN